MTVLIIYALLLTLIQLWILPASLNLKNMAYLVSSRDSDAPDQSILQGRISRAGANLQENMLAFLPLSILSIIQQVDLSHLAMIWLGLRILYLLCYMFTLIYVRTLVWLASLVCLVMMAVELI